MRLGAAVWPIIGDLAGGEAPTNKTCHHDCAKSGHDTVTVLAARINKWA